MRPTLCIVLVSAWLALSGDIAKAQTAAGRVISVRPPGSVTIKRSNKPDIVAETGILLQPGDRFDMGPGAFVRAVVYGGDETYDINRQDRAIPPRDVGWFSTDDSGFLAGIERFLTQPRRSIPAFSQARGGSGSDVKPLQYDPLVPGGRQFLPSGKRKLALVWRDGATHFNVSGPGGEPTEIDSGTRAWVRVPVQIGHSPVAIQSSDGALRWSIEPSETIPAPPWFTNDAHGLSEARRLTRAVWFLREGPAEWHVFALSELADLADAGNFTAAQLWQGVRSAEWETGASDER